MSSAIAYVWPLSDPLASTDWLASSKSPAMYSPSGIYAAMAAAAGGGAMLFGLIFIVTRTSIRRTFFWYKVTYGRPAVVHGLIMSVVGLGLLTFAIPHARIHLRDNRRVREWKAAHPNTKELTLGEVFGRRTSDVFAPAVLMQEVMRECDPVAKQRKLKEYHALLERMQRTNSDQNQASSAIGR